MEQCCHLPSVEPQATSIELSADKEAHGKVAALAVCSANALVALQEISYIADTTPGVTKRNVYLNVCVCVFIYVAFKCHVKPR